MANHKKLVQELEAAGVISEGQVYRMRLFSPNERQVLRDALMDAGRFQGRPSYLPLVGGSGMMGELEMVNFQAHGKDHIERQI